MLPIQHERHQCPLRKEQRAQFLPRSGLQLPQRVDLRLQTIQIGDNAARRINQKLPLDERGSCKIFVLARMRQ